MSPTDLGTALRPLAGPGLYHGNAFHLTGLPVGATARLIRSRRAETELAARLGTSAGVGPHIDPQDLRAAFESLGDPVHRLIHEVLWLWQADDAVPPELAALSARGAELRLHREAMEAEPSRNALDADRLDEMWRRGLAAWAEVLSSERLWDWATARVGELDDPRLTRGTVRRLRESLPVHIVAVHAALTALAVESGDEDADRFVRLADESPFDDDVVERGLRQVTRVCEQGIRQACEAARRATAADAAESARELLDRTAVQLRVVATILTDRDPLVPALRDEVAAAANKGAVVHYEHSGGCGPVLGVLHRARELAMDPATIELIDSNLAVVGRDPHLLAVAALCESGRVDRAAGYLRALARRLHDEQERERLVELLADGTEPRAPVERAPGDGWLGPFAGLGWVGTRPGREAGTHIATHVLVVPLLLLIVPLAAYERDSRYFYAKVPLSTFSRWWRRGMGVLGAVGATWAFGAVVALLILGAVAAGLLVRRWHLHRWLREQRTGAE
ncbi:hypothetical protein [Saccharopolyspora sp. NPDC002578]